MSDIWKPNPRFRPELDAAINEGVNAYYITLSKALREQLSKRGTGRTYRRGRGRVRQRSAPGQPPSPDTGELRRSWLVGKAAKSITMNPDLVSLRFGSRLHYARIDGGYGRVKPRPYIRPTLDSIAELFPVTIARAIKKTIRSK
jgi:hypothetical protein